MDGITPAFAMALAYPIGLGLAALGAGLGLGRVVSSALESMSRQPSQSGSILMVMIIGCAFIEALVIYALISPYLANLTFLAEKAVAP